jgi:hypothetical protein
VICTSCARWNLSPLDERYEVIEHCERLYRDTTKRMSTDNIGLARMPDGMVLVRIGDPVFPEYASWRYGQRFMRREQTALLSTSAGVVALLVGLVMVGGPVAPISGAGATLYGSYRLSRLAMKKISGWRRLGEIPLADGRTETLNVARARSARIVALPDGGWTLAVPEFRGAVRILRSTSVVDEVTDEEAADGAGILGWSRTYDLVAPEHAEAVARRVMPVVNHAGGDDEMVSGAAKLHEQWEGRIGETVSKLVQWRRRPMTLAGEPHLALAFEMSVYEEQEQRWLQTQLYLLKHAWKEAEELAAIADDLTLPEWVAEKLGSLKGGV